MKMILILQFFQEKNNTVVIEKIRIESFEILKSEEIKNKREFLEDAFKLQSKLFFFQQLILLKTINYFSTHTMTSPIT